jgi:hypothetical protein
MDNFSIFSQVEEEEDYINAWEELTFEEQKMLYEEMEAESFE